MPETAETTLPPRHLHQLDALRGAACLAVLFAHLKAVKQLQWMPDIAGTIGVGLFFALSGFLITRLLIIERRERRGLLGFYNRRVARIFPIYYLTVGAIALFRPSRELTWVANFTFNFRFLTSSRDYFCVDPSNSQVPPVAHFWSLCVEEHFYWVWPLAVYCLPLCVSRLLPLIVISCTPLAAWYIGDFLSASGFSRPEVAGLLSRITLTQLVAISVGCLAAFHETWLTMSIWHYRRMSVTPACAIGTFLSAAALTALIIVEKFSPTIAATISGTLLHLACGGAFLIALALPSLARIQILCRVGTISYGMYLYHLPVYACYGLTNSAEGAGAARGAAAFASVVAIALLSYQLIEKPLLTWVRHQHHPERNGSRRMSVCGLAATLAVAAAFTNSLGSSSVSELPALIPQPASTTAIEAIVVGSSHAERGVVATEFAMPTYNVAFDSQDIWYDCGIVMLLADRLPNLKRVVFTMSTFTFRSAIADWDDDKWRQALYYHAWGLHSQNTGEDQRKYSLLVLDNSEAELSRMRAKAALVDETNRGWLPVNTANAVDRGSGPFHAEQHRIAGTRRVEENKRMVLATVASLKAKGIECVFVSTPTLSCYREHLTDEQRSEIVTIARELCDETRSRFLDYSEDERFTEEDFFDCDHLNGRGAIKFTRIFDADISLHPQGTSP